MNKERAREILKDFSQQLNDRIFIIYKDNEDLLQALDIAIDSIEHEEKCNKAINDSAKAIAKMQRLCKKCHTNNEWVDVRDRLPSEEDLVKAGQYGFYITVQCGKLKRVEEADYDLDTKEWNYNREFSGEEVIAWRHELRPYERKE